MKYLRQVQSRKEMYLAQFLKLKAPTALDSLLWLHILEQVVTLILGSLAQVCKASILLSNNLLLRINSEFIRNILIPLLEITSCLRRPYLKSFTNS